MNSFTAPAVCTAPHRHYHLPWGTPDRRRIL